MRLRKPSRQFLIHLAMTLASVCFALLVSDVLFRALLFHAPSLMKSWRNPGLYADPQSSEDYWKLRVLFGAQPAARDEPLLGYLKADIAPGTYLHAKADEAGPRRPVLLYGDSFAQCAVPPSECFDGILNFNPRFAQGHYLINYGVGAFGLDQIYLLFSKSIDHFRDPIVIFSILDDDIDRCVMGVREGQKPFFTLRDGQLELRGLPIESDQKRFFAERPPEIRSYLGRLVLFSVFPGWLSANHPRAPKTEMKKEIGAALVLRISEELRSRNLRHVFLIFEGLHRTWRRPLNWRIQFLEDLFREHRIPHLWARQAVEDNTTREDFRDSDYVISREDPHPNARANELVANRILDWLQTGRTDGM